MHLFFVLSINKKKKKNVAPEVLMTSEASAIWFQSIGSRVICQFHNIFYLLRLSKEVAASIVNAKAKGRTRTRTWTWMKTTKARKANVASVVRFRSIGLWRHVARNFQLVRWQSVETVQQNTDDHQIDNLRWRAAVWKEKQKEEKVALDGMQFERNRPNVVVVCIGCGFSAV